MTHWGNNQCDALTIYLTIYSSNIYTTCDALMISSNYYSSEYTAFPTNNVQTSLGLVQRLRLHIIWMDRDVLYVNTNSLEVILVCTSGLVQVQEQIYKRSKQMQSSFVNHCTVCDVSREISEFTYNIVFYMYWKTCKSIS